MSNQWPPPERPPTPNAEQTLQPAQNAAWQPPLDGQQPPKPKANKQLTLIVTVLVIVTGLLTAGGLMLINRDSNSAEVGADFIVTSAEVPPPVFEPRNEEGDNAFFPLDLQLAGFEEAVGIMPTAADIETGNFGGTLEDTCDPERLISFLYDNPSQGEAWAQVQGIEFNQIADYIRSLEVRMLAEPALVLNHGFRNGVATEFEATLDAGTAVLVDAEGNIRTRCYCGNPITPKPVVYKQPRCVIMPQLVFTGPGGKDPIEPPSLVITATGQIATNGDGDWVELEWSNGHGWTPVSNVQEANCPPPIVDTFECPGPGEIPVFATSAGVEQVGRLNGTIAGASGAVFVNASIDRVGGANGSLSENGHTLIRFTQGTGSDTAWVNIADLGVDFCEPVQVCIDLFGSRLARPFPNASRGLGDPGVHAVQFTGHFVDQPYNDAEAHFLDSGGTSWIDLAEFTPLPDSACELDDFGSCYVPRDGNRASWSEPGRNGDVVATFGRGRGPAVFPIANVAPVLAPILGDPDQTPVPWVQAQIGSGGPTGWLLASALNNAPSECAPQPRCLNITGPVYASYTLQGTPLPVAEGTQIVRQHAVTVRAGSLKLLLDFEEGGTGWTSDVEFVNDDACERDYKVGDRVCLEFSLQPEPDDGSAISSTDFFADILEVTPGEPLFVQVVTNGPSGYSVFDPDPSHTCEDIGEHVCVAPIAEMWPSFPPSGPPTESPDPAWGLIHYYRAYVNQDRSIGYHQVTFDDGGTFWFALDGHHDGEGCDEPPTDERFGPCRVPTSDALPPGHNRAASPAATCQ